MKKFNSLLKLFSLIISFIISFTSCSTPVIKETIPDKVNELHKGNILGSLSVKSVNNFLPTEADGFIEVFNKKNIKIGGAIFETVAGYINMREFIAYEKSPVISIYFDRKRRDQNSDEEYDNGNPVSVELRLYEPCSKYPLIKEGITDGTFVVSYINGANGKYEIKINGEILGDIKLEGVHNASIIDTGKNSFNFKQSSKDLWNISLEQDNEILTTKDCSDIGFNSSNVFKLNELKDGKYLVRYKSLNRDLELTKELELSRCEGFTAKSLPVFDKDPYFIEPFEIKDSFEATLLGIELPPKDKLNSYQKELSRIKSLIKRISNVSSPDKKALLEEELRQANEVKNTLSQELLGYIPQIDTSISDLRSLINERLQEELSVDSGYIPDDFNSYINLIIESEDSFDLNVSSGNTFALMEAMSNQLDEYKLYRDLLSDYLSGRFDSLSDGYELVETEDVGDLIRLKKPVQVLRYLTNKINSQKTKFNKKLELLNTDVEKYTYLTNGYQEIENNVDKLSSEIDNAVIIINNEIEKRKQGIFSIPELEIDSLLFSIKMNSDQWNEKLKPYKDKHEKNVDDKIKLINNAIQAFNDLTDSSIPKLETISEKLEKLSDKNDKSKENISNQKNYNQELKDNACNNPKCGKQDVLLSKSDEKLLKKNGYDIHQIKKDIVGKRNVSKYDLYQNKSTGEVFLKLKGGKGEGQPTGINIKELRRN